MIQLLIAYLVKAFIVILAAAFLTRIRGLSAAMRHRIWTLAFAAVLLLLPLSYLLPSVHLGLSPSGPASVGAQVLLLSWLSVAVLLVARIVLDQLALARLRAGTAEAKDEAVLGLAHEAMIEMGFSRAVQIRHWDGSMPATFGIFRPVILLPGAAIAWPAERLKLTLLHEMGHIVRRDAASHALSRIVAAIHWFNPLCLWALGKARAQCEYACDDLVLRTGAKARNYASALISTARDNAADEAVIRLGIMAMTPVRNLEDRLTRIFSSAPSTHRRRPRVFALAAGVLVGLAVLIAPARFETPDRSSYALPGRL